MEMRRVGTSPVRRREPSDGLSEPQYGVTAPLALGLCSPQNTEPYPPNGARTGAPHALSAMTFSTQPGQLRQSLLDMI